ncbi:hypothetical protein [Nocardia fusca]|uniref:hypothetical protein n=1 Tax=Nocardia fusca TaxID=941183 RepID=UPI0012F4A97F|nr:hypothetical protein [Nocardia fusca]
MRPHLNDIDACLLVRTASSVLHGHAEPVALDPSLGETVQEAGSSLAQVCGRDRNAKTD